MHSLLTDEMCLPWCTVRRWGSTSQGTRTSGASLAFSTSLTCRNSCACQHHWMCSPLRSKWKCTMKRAWCIRWPSGHIQSRLCCVEKVIAVPRCCCAFVAAAEGDAMADSSLQWRVKGDDLSKSFSHGDKYPKYSNKAWKFFNPSN